jgi:hypothetical protein
LDGPHAARPLEETTMPLMTDRQSVAANATVANVLAGKIDEFLRTPSLIRLYAKAEALGVNVSLIVGQSVLLDDQEIGVGAAGVTIVKPDDFVIEGGGLASDRIILRLRNTTAGAIVVRTQLETIPA